MRARLARDLDRDLIGGKPHTVQQGLGYGLKLGIGLRRRRNRADGVR